MTNSGLLANYRPQLLQNHPTHLVRQIHGTGQFQAVVGQDVAPDTIIGQYQQPAGFSTINLAQRLGTSAQDAQKFLQKNIGQNIYKGELLAEKKGLFNDAIVTSPTDGVLQSYDQTTGVMLLKFFPKTVTLTAGVYGVIDKIDPKSGQIKIKTFVDQVNCIAGSGRQRLGVLDVIDNPANLAKPEQLTEAMRGHIVVVGALIEHDALVKAVSLGISGIITGGINYTNFQPLINKFDANIHMKTDVGLTLTVLIGFDANPIQPHIFNLFQQFAGQFVYINGEPSKILLPSATEADIESLRKIVLPEDENEVELDVKSLEIGQTVRVVASPYMGASGKIINIDKSPTTLESGVATYLLTIDSNSRKIKVPYPNVEII